MVPDEANNNQQETMMNTTTTNNETRTVLTTLAEIQAAVEAGKTVCVGSDSYVVKKDNIGQWLIVCRLNGYTIGLTHRDGVTMNVQPGECYMLGEAIVAKPAFRKATPLDMGLLLLLLEQLNTVRRKCPGIGGDVDAANVRWMMEHREWHESTVAQAMKTLRSLGGALGTATDAADAVEERAALVQGGAK